MKQHSMIRRPDLRGFALIEALIAVVVLATGLLALTALLGALVRSSADSKARSQVAAYAASEMDRIRTGEAPVASLSATSGGTDDISRTAAAAGLSVLSQAYCAQTYVANASGIFSTADVCTPTTYTGKNAWFRRVTLNMGWTDATGGSRTLSMTTDISPLALTASKVLVDRTPSDDTGLRPIIRRPSPVTEGMIPIATGGDGDEATAATNPKPKLFGGESGTYVSDTRFDVLTYSSVDTPPDFVRFNKKIETAIVGCTCQKGTGGFTSHGPDSYLDAFLVAKAYRPTYWDGRTYKTPVAAATIAGSPANVSQSALCDVCCRDHNDPALVSGPKFSPWPGQDARHYNVDAGGAYVEAATNGDQYMEACRIIRVDGVFRVAADPKIQDNALVPTREYTASPTSGSSLPTVPNNDAATSSRLDDDGKPLYENYAYDAVSTMFFSTVAVADIGNSVDFAAIQQSDGLNNPVYVPIKPANDRRWLHSRVFMTDYLESDARTRLQEASAECADTSTSKLKAQCVLPYIPLASINTTEIASWSPRAATAAEMTAAPSPLNALPANYLDYASAKIRRFNSGLALVGAINSAEATLDTTTGLSPAVDEQLFVQLAAAAPTEPVWLNTPSPNPSAARIFGDVLNPMRGYAQTSAPIPFNLSWDFGNPGSPTTDSNKGNDPAATVTGSGACTPNAAGNTSNPYACSTSTASNVEVTIAGYNRIEHDTNFNNPCGAGKVDKPTCVVYTLTGASVNNPAASVGTSTLVSGTAGKLDEVRSVIVPGVNATPASTVTLSFTKSTPATTYTCNATTPVWVLPCQ
jgi:type IV pilus modification protein PilV